ncbi:prepilin peptidase [Georgenia sp. Z1344]|uniref:prepilin peptidase n=1 Tax=Georgenia sp. Z1344 TaxID=3416706 RepID=UPI003CF0862E
MDEAGRTAGDAGRTDDTTTPHPRPRPRATAFGAVGPVSVVVAAIVALAVVSALLTAGPGTGPFGGGPEGSSGTGHDDAGTVSAGIARAGWALAGGWLAGVGVLLAVTDHRTHRLPDKLLIGGGAVALPLLVAAALLAGEPGALLRAAAGALVPAGVLYAVALVTPGGVGLGDVKLLLLTGAWLGFLSVPAATVGPVLGIVVGGLVSIVAVVARRATLRSHVPLGPALLVGAAVATWLDLAGALTLAPA